METLNASDAKREFGEMLLKSQQGPVGINKNGKPVAVMISATAYAEFEAMKRQLLQKEINKGLADIEAGRIEDGETVFKRLTQRIVDAEL
ncbi:MAG: type II toxin-antitoxin system Phd/YefM family antitoxin [Wenzhouxiangellaceae bacterium]